MSASALALQEVSLPKLEVEEELLKTKKQGCKIAEPLASRHHSPSSACQPQPVNSCTRGPGGMFPFGSVLKAGFCRCIEGEKLCIEKRKVSWTLTFDY